MPIETDCPGCSRRLRVADEHAGKTARCPKCGTLYTVPGAKSNTAATPAGSEAPRDQAAWNSGQPAAEPWGGASPLGRDAGKWRLQTEDGQVYGPVTKGDLDNWVAQGRVTPDSQVQQVGDAFWQRAATVYPELAITQPAAQNPFADLSAAEPPNPYAPQAAYGGVRQSWQQNHRGGLILALGLLGWIFGCPFFGPIALLMGLNDLKKINDGTMDPGGKGLTIAGTVLGGLYTLVFIGFILLIFLAAVLDA